MYLTPTQIIALNTRLRAEANALRDSWDDCPELLPCDENDEDMALAALLDKAASALMSSMERDCEINEHLRRLWINKPIIDRGLLLYSREIDSIYSNNWQTHEHAQGMLEDTRKDFNRCMAAVTKRLSLVDKS
jgi:hypothetical protein